MKKVLLYGSLALNLAWLLIYLTTPPKDTAEEGDAEYPTLEQTVYRTLIIDGPSTIEDLTESTGLPRTTISPRLAPLKRQGLVQPWGQKTNKSGRLATIWKAL
jgi:uncharacterized membrane protein